MIEGGSFDMSKEDYEKFKCCLCDEHLKNRYLELKEILNKIFKNYLKLFRNTKTNDLKEAHKWENEMTHSLHVYIVRKSILDKMIEFRKEFKGLDYQDRMKV